MTASAFAAFSTANAPPLPPSPAQVVICMFPPPLEQTSDGVQVTDLPGGVKAYNPKVLTKDAVRQTVRSTQRLSGILRQANKFFSKPAWIKGAHNPRIAFDVGGVCTFKGKCWIIDQHWHEYTGEVSDIHVWRFEKREFSRASHEPIEQMKEVVTWCILHMGVMNVFIITRINNPGTVAVTTKQMVEDFGVRPENVL